MKKVTPVTSHQSKQCNRCDLLYGKLLKCVAKYFQDNMFGIITGLQKPIHLCKIWLSVYKVLPSVEGKSLNGIFNPCP